jgi:hypothetical protein
VALEVDAQLSFKRVRKQHLSAIRRASVLVWDQ